MNWKHSLFIASIVCLSLGCNQNQSKKNNTSQSPKLSGFELTNYVGSNLQKAVKKSEQGKLVEEGDLVNGKKTGTWTTYHLRTGLPDKIVTYHEGQKQGMALKMSDRGQILEKMYYANDVLNGVKYAYKYNRILEESIYKDGELDGTRKLYYETGKQLKEEGNFKNGKRTGVNTWYKESGEISLQYRYEDGKRVGDLTEKAKAEAAAKPKEATK